ncbi:2-oxoglutarate dehydrogenase, putative [Ricinus communis]|uniref:2-oxoglutarate dehydrogenase, putative n=1 Tax=Ricinus communis TaxID=3988 RepID=B9SR43_RICCO|nr:2-oxoglutarate dehydrogenase, putative [Ricinus communis]
MKLYILVHFLTTGGTIHIVVNNQVAFTTDPRSGRSSRYCTDVALALNAPIFHVNGDDMEAVAHVCELAAEWRQTFHSDVVVDIICYRRFGHNKVDEPSFTQPKMYKVIQKHPSSLKIYENKFLESGEVTEEVTDRIHRKVNRILNEEYSNSKYYSGKTREWLSSQWSGFKSPEQISQIRNTGINRDVLKTVGSHVRFSGQDVERGTFSQRHAMVHDQGSGKQYCPLNHIMLDQNEEMLTVSFSSLLEFGVLGFESGYSMENPNALVMWEAQFGDFSNGVQAMFDQFLRGGESKWLRQSGLVLLLPHGYDGQGPEHSSARLECFLMMSDNDPYVGPEMESSVRKRIQKCNWQVVNVTTPANYFHVLRRQVRIHDSGSDKQGTRFKRLVKDQNNHSDLEEGIRRLLLCSGKVYYELDEKRDRVNGKNIAICRVEELSPFPYDLIQRELKRCPNAEIIGCQEEPTNIGAYSYMLPRLYTALKAIGRGSFEDIKYVGRDTSASTATGFYSIHKNEQIELVQVAMQPEPIKSLY